MEIETDSEKRVEQAKNIFIAEIDRHREGIPQSCGPIPTCAYHSLARELENSFPYCRGQDPTSSSVDLRPFRVHEDETLML